MKRWKRVLIFPSFCKRGRNKFPRLWTFFAVHYKKNWNESRPREEYCIRRHTKNAAASVPSVLSAAAAGTQINCDNLRLLWHWGASAAAAATFHPLKKGVQNNNCHNKVQEVLPLDRMPNSNFKSKSYHISHIFSGTKRDIWRFTFPILFRGAAADKFPWFDQFGEESSHNGNWQMLLEARKRCCTHEILSNWWHTFQQLKTSKFGLETGIAYGVAQAENSKANVFRWTRDSDKGRRKWYLFFEAFPNQISNCTRNDLTITISLVVDLNRPHWKVSLARHPRPAPFASSATKEAPLPLLLLLFQPPFLHVNVTSEIVLGGATPCDSASATTGKVKCFILRSSHLFLPRHLEQTLYCADRIKCRRKKFYGQSLSTLTGTLLQYKENSRPQKSYLTKRAFLLVSKFPANLDYLP